MGIKNAYFLQPSRAEIKKMRHEVRSFFPNFWVVKMSRLILQIEFDISMRYKCWISDPVMLLWWNEPYYIVAYLSFSSWMILMKKQRRNFYPHTFFRVNNTPNLLIRQILPQIIFRPILELNKMPISLFYLQHHNRSRKKINNLIN